MNTAEHRFLSRHKTAVFAVMAGVVIILLECVAFNLPFWTTLSASRDSQSALNTLGSGLVRQSDGTIRVTDPTSAFLTVEADGSSRFVRIDPAESTFRFTSPANVLGVNANNTEHPPQRGHASQTPLTAFHIRIDANGQTSQTRSVSTHVPNSLYLTTPSLNSAPQTTHLKIWIEEPAGTQVDIAAVRTNVRVPFHADWGRIAALAILVALIVLWMPGSRLWRTRLDTANVRQRLAFAGFMVVVGLLAVLAIVRELWSANSSTFHEPGEYTYDFNQYGHMADALLHGRTSIDLPVPDALKQAANPYDPQTRDTLLSRGVSPIYWDYAYHNGHWYSYFGVLPALLLFAPYRLVTSLFINGGLMLPSGAAVAFLVFIFVLFGSLLVIRLLKKLNPNTSLATVSMAITLFILGSQVGYLMFRMNFYSVPFAASLALSVMGLWFWIGAAKDSADIGDATQAKKHSDSGSQAGSAQSSQSRRHASHHLISIGTAQPLSWPHLVAGSLCLAANFGCRPTFTLVALLAFPIFWQQIREILRKPSKNAGRSVPRKSVVTVLCAVLLPALVIVIPLCIYNAVRFGSPIDFGERYQITVADMTHYRNSLANLLPTLGYYLFLPLHFSKDFPFLTINPTPLTSWSYAEPLAGGLFALCPMLLLVVLLLVPGIRRRCRHSGLLRIVLSTLPLALLLLLVDSVKGGIGWRYMLDFGWLIALAGIVVLGAISGDAQPCSRTKTLHADQNDAIASEKASSPSSSSSLHHWVSVPRLGHRMVSKASPTRIAWGRVIIRLMMLLLVLASIVVAFLVIFVPGREDALTRANPALFQAVASWFTL
ncbi:glycosyltransferase [Bifidobacterium sp. ESL0682]|uniref:glycosyltransferase n=1 Tax=Bifidobacterium sp. ESL0682 TaxID=2983212 RepID=UPI0023F9263D|nr:glycosyltransferase [Bifidobacterium sp. ESL0682]WEV41417.1 glycosyltransferase [Bifidobacterium sp. ESL0682]